VPVGWNWNDLTARLNAREFDALISAVAVNKERERAVDFVEYLRLAVVFVCRRGVSVQSEKDLTGKIVALQEDTPSARHIQQLRREGQAIKEVLVLKGTAEPFEAIRRGRADVTVSQEPIARQYAGDDLVVMGTTRHSMDPEPVGIAFRKGDQSLQSAVADALRTMKEDGTFAQMLDEWFGN
jgi:polar amino acid transport system substrate-binding protein